MEFTLSIIFYRFLILLLVLEPIIALPWHSRRDMTWGDSPGQAIINMGAAGFGALNQLWNLLTLPSTETEYTPNPNPSQPQPEAPNTPQWSTPPSFESDPMKICSAVTQPIGAPDNQLPGEGDADEYGGPYVQQNTKTG